MRGCNSSWSHHITCIIKGENNPFFFSPCTVLWGKGAWVAKAERIVGAALFVWPLSGPGTCPAAFAGFFSFLGIGLWTSGHPGSQPWSSDCTLLQQPPAMLPVWIPPHPHPHPATPHPFSRKHGWPHVQRQSSHWGEAWIQQTPCLCNRGPWIQPATMTSSSSSLGGSETGRKGLSNFGRSYSTYTSNKHPPKYNARKVWFLLMWHQSDGLVSLSHHFALFIPHDVFFFFLSSLFHSMMEGPTATNRAMLPSLGQKVKCRPFYFFTWTHMQRYDILTPNLFSSFI